MGQTSYYSSLSGSDDDDDGEWAFVSAGPGAFIQEVSHPVTCPSPVLIACPAWTAKGEDDEGEAGLDEDERGGQEQGGQVGVATMGATPIRNTTTAAIVIIEITKNH